VITSSPPRPPFAVSTSGDALGLEVGDAEGDGEPAGDGASEGDGEAAGVGVGDPCSVKLAQGFGCTLAHRWCTPGESPGNGVTPFVKLPPESVVTLAATRDCESQ
jgi:hypothetical protein